MPDLMVAVLVWLMMNGTDGNEIQTEENDMKQNRILNYIGAAGLLLAVSACGKEDLNTTVDGGNGGTTAALPEGTFVVDYSVSDGETSRALDANQRINSLLYLLYDSEGELVKEREIPGIGKDTKWPLKRENMTWEQREALKDTLNSGSTYTAVFLANVKKDLFGETQTEELLQNKENLTKAVLYLPQTPFTDNNMYYLWKEELEYTQPEGASDDSRDNPLSKNIILRRLVSRIDMGSAITDETEDEVVKAGMGINFDQLLVDGIKDNGYSGFIDDLKAKLPNDDTWIANCSKLLELLKNKIENLTSSNYNYSDYIERLVSNCKSGNEYLNQTQDWNGTAIFNLTDMHNRMSINDLTSSYDNSITSPTYTYPITEGKATWIGFACNEAAKMSFTDITLKGSKTTDDGDESFELRLDFTPVEIFLQKNGLVTYTCNPIAEIKPKGLSSGATYSDSFDVVINMAETYGSLDNLLTTENGFSFDNTNNTQTAFKNAIEGVFSSWGNVTLSIKIPTSDEFTYTTTITEQTNP